MDLQEEESGCQRCLSLSGWVSKSAVGESLLRNTNQKQTQCSIRVTIVNIPRFCLAPVYPRSRRKEMKSLVDCTPIAQAGIPIKARRFVVKNARHCTAEAVMRTEGKEGQIRKGSAVFSD